MHPIIMNFQLKQMTLFLFPFVAKNVLKHNNYSLCLPDHWKYQHNNNNKKLPDHPQIIMNTWIKRVQHYQHIHKALQQVMWMEVSINQDDQSELYLSIHHLQMNHVSIEWEQEQCYRKNQNINVRINIQILEKCVYYIK